MSCKFWPWKTLILTSLSIFILAACLPATRSSPEESIQIPAPEASATAITEPSVEESQNSSTPTLPPPVIRREEEGSSTETDVEETSPATEITRNGDDGEGASGYRVVFVEEDDVLNVRKGPGVDFEIVGEIQPGTRGVEVTGQGEGVIDSLWLPIEYEDVAGWVNSRFLTEDISQEQFCNDEEIEELVEMAFEAFVSQDGEGLSQLVAEGRSLRLRRHWWNPEVNIKEANVADLFDSEKDTSWGNEDGSGKPIEGSYSEVIQPLVERNLEAHSERSCNEILHSGTAGLVQLPPSYEGINYYSLYRPAGPDEFELDWGTWVMGIEIWQGQPTLSFMVHYEWEI